MQSGSARVRRSFDDAGLELGIALVIAWGLVIARSLVFLVYEQSLFDSDQAIVGLMAKHLAEGRAFPLFYYGQGFLLGVEAWLAVPMFWIAGASVAALHASLMITNLAVGTLLVIGLSRSGGLHPFEALAASLFFLLAPPLTSAFLLTANGANIEPFLFLVILWFLRDRPLWFGCVLGVGFLTREFTVYAVPVILFAQVLEGAFVRTATLRHWLLVAVAFSAVLAGVDALKPFADTRGPGTRGVMTVGTPASEVRNLSDRANVNAREFPARIEAMVLDHVPRLAGATASLTGAWREWMAWLFLTVLALALVRALFLSVRGERSFAFGEYLLGLGAAAAAGYIITRPAGENTPRYYLLVLFVPIGITAVFLANETRAWLRRVMLTAIVLWALVSVVDQVKEFAYYHSGAEPNASRALADALVARDVKIAQAGYWRAYKLTFMTRERVKLAATDVARIDEYQQLAAQAGPDLLTLQDAPCPGGVPVASSFLCH